MSPGRRGEARPGPCLYYDDSGSPFGSLYSRLARETTPRRKPARTVAPAGRSGGSVRNGGLPGEVAQLIAFLVSPGAAHLSGSQFTADGGVLSAV